MANFFKPSKPTTDRYFDLDIIGLDGRCNGIGKTKNRTWFVPNTMPGDKIKAELTEVSKNTGFAKVQKFYSKSNERIDSPCCQTNCGGCSCQFIPIKTQILAKMDGIKQIFRKNAGFELEEPIKIVEGDTFHYRRTCRLSTYFNRKTNRLEVGFRQSNSHKIEEVSSCMVLTETLSNIINTVRSVINKISVKEFIGHIELTEAENGTHITIQYNKDLSKQDLELLKKELVSESVNVSIIDKNKKLQNLNPNYTQPFYLINNIKLEFSPESFIQINGKVNESIISTVIDFADISTNDSILDLFCGMGNLTLPLAQKAKNVTGVEVVAQMINQAKNNAQKNNINNASFIEFDLSTDFSNEEFAQKQYNCIILDPGREGAGNAIDFICQKKVNHIVYVSCNPITVTRDMAKLKNAGYIIENWALFNMFSHTEHIEAVFNIYKTNKKGICK